MTFSVNLGSIGSFTSHSGSAPSPFDALNGSRLAGSQGSHPLHSVQPDELVRPNDGGPLTGSITLDHPVRVGEGIDGTVQLMSAQHIASRKAALRLVGLRLDEVQRSREDRDSKGNVVHTEYWVETQGKLFSEDAFLEPAVPATLEPGAPWQARFSIPAPRLGPPSAHLGESIIAWAVEVRFDIAMGSDHFVAILVPVGQNPDLMAAGVGKQGGTSLMADIDVGGGAVISVTSPLPAPSGSEIAVKVAWPSAPGGQGARIELHRRTNAPNGVEGIIASVPVDPASLTSGAAEARLLIPAGSAPSFDGAGLEITYILRVLVDRRLRNDAAIERPVGIV